VILGLDGQPDTRDDAAFVETLRRSARLPWRRTRGDLPRAQWRPRLQDMARFSLTGVGVPEGKQSALAQLDLEPFVRYFEARAPETLAAPSPGRRPGGPGFERTTLSPKRAAPVPIVADTRFFDLDGDGRPESWPATSATPRVRRRAAAHARRAARDREGPEPGARVAGRPRRDGRQDLLIADVGFFMPEDNTKGSVVWLRARATARSRSACWPRSCRG